jgi:hypothetical protein
MAKQSSSSAEPQPADRLPSAGERCRSLLIPRLAACGLGRLARAVIGSACKFLLIPRLAVHGRACLARRRIVNPCRSLLIPPAHLGAGAGAGAFALGAFFLPLAGAVGSSCA